jgi:beta-galactosidase GanA
LEVAYSTEFHKVISTDVLKYTMGYNCSLIFDVIQLLSASAKAVYASDYYCDTPVITANEYGSGSAFYIGSLFNAEDIGALLLKLMPEIIPGLEEIPELSE